MCVKQNKSIILADKIEQEATGVETWSVMNRDETAYCISFDHRENHNPRRECLEWFEEQQKNRPAWIESNGYHIVQSTQYLTIEKLAREAAGVLREDARILDDMAALVRQLSNALRNTAPNDPKNELPEKALDYLKRVGMQGSILREHD